MNKKLTLSVAGVVVALATIGAVVLRAAPTIGEVTVTPTVIGVNTPTQVTVTAKITDSLLIPTSVNLLRVDANSKTLAILGSLRDDGTNGDVAAGDKVFTYRFNANEGSTGEMRLQVSAAFRGVLRRSVSAASVVSVWATFVSQTHDYSLNYPPSMIAESPSPDRLLINSTSVAEGDQPAAIELVLFPHSFTAELAYLRSIIVRDRTETRLTLAGRPAVRVTGILADDVFDWGGSYRGFIIVERQDGEVYRFQYNAADPPAIATFESLLSSFRLP